MATANLRAFNELNPDFGELTQPTISELMDAIDAEAQSEKFEGGNSAKSAALKQGCNFVFGLIVSGRGHVRKDLNCVVADWFSGKHFERWAHYCSEDVVAKALKACVHDHRSMVAPPYLACALVEPDGGIRRLWLRPIWLSAKGCALVESEVERRAWNIQNFKEHVFFRPIREEDTERLTLLETIEDEAFRGHKWDMIRFEKTHLRSSWISPIEVYGYRKGANNDYDRRRDVGDSRINRLFRPFIGNSLEGLDIAPTEYEKWANLGLVFSPTRITKALREFLMPTLGGSGLGERPPQAGSR